MTDTTLHTLKDNILNELEALKEARQSIDIAKDECGVVAWHAIGVVSDKLENALSHINALLDGSVDSLLHTATLTARICKSAAHADESGNDLADQLLQEVGLVQGPESNLRP